MPERPGDERVKAWQRRRCSGADKRLDDHRQVQRGSCEQEEGKEWSYDIAEEKRKARW
jgi:hypothetical protein